MKRIMKKYLTFGLLSLALSTSVFAGNGDRAGEAGAAQLLINPWTRSSGMGAANSASVMGLEALYSNVAGIAFTNKTELVFSRTAWLVGTDININTFGFSQKVGDAGTLAVGIMSMNSGEIQRTTVASPDGGIGTFTVEMMNMNLAYAQEFSNSIYGGINVKVVTEKIPDVSTSGIAIDAGIQYVTGENDNVRFGISLKNVGPDMTYRGDGLSFRGSVPNGNIQTVQQRSEGFGLPSLLNIGGSYRFDFNESNNLTAAGTFTSNAFSYDQFRFGLMYSFKEILKLRVGYIYEEGVLDAETRQTALTGPAAGFSIDIPWGENGSKLGIEYSYRATNPFGGTHNFGGRITL